MFSRDVVRGAVHCDSGNRPHPGSIGGHRPVPVPHEQRGGSDTPPHHTHQTGVQSEDSPPGHLAGLHRTL